MREQIWPVVNLICVKYVLPNKSGNHMVGPRPGGTCGLGPCGAFPQIPPGDACSTALPAQRMGGGERGEVAEDVGGGRRKKRHSLQRQDTFVLQDEHDSAEVEDGGSGLGILTILGKAEMMTASMSREYLSSHWAMLGKEVSRLEEELAGLRQERTEEKVKHKKEVQDLHQKLEKERAKNKVLIARQKARGGEDEDTITIAGVSPRRSSLPSSPRAPRSAYSLTSERLSTASTSKKGETRRLGKKLKGYKEQVSGLNGEVERLRGLLAVHGEAGEADVERVRLGELVDLLTGRLEEAEEKMVEAEAGRREEVRKSARAEKALESCRLRLREAGVSPSPSHSLG